MRENIIEKIQRSIHPLLLNIMKMQRNFEIDIDGIIPENQPLIFVANHFDVHDIPIAGEAIKRHMYVLVSDEDKNTLDGFLLNINGVEWVNRLNKKSRKESKERLLRHLAIGHSILIYPEATWNLSPNLLMLPMNYGVIDISLISSTPICPIVTHYENGTYYIKIGNLFYPTNDKIESINNLRDIMATQAYELMEKHSFVNRVLLPSNYLEQDIARRYNDYDRARKDPIGVQKYESQFIFQPKGIVSSEEAFEHLNNIEYNKNNAFLLKRR